MHHFAHKRPTKNRRFSYARIPGADNIVTWRLYRKDVSGAAHMDSLLAFAGTPRGQVARGLLTVRKSLLDDVDRIDFELLGVVA